MEWQADVLDGFEQLTLPLADDDEGPVVATLVRRIQPGPHFQNSDADVLYVHGWVDYFHQIHLANFFESLGYRFYALDLRKYGRSIREWQTPGFTESLRVYNEDIDAALAAMGHPTLPPHPPEKSSTEPDTPAAAPDKPLNTPDDVADPGFSGLVGAMMPQALRNIIESAKSGFAEAALAASQTANEGSAAEPSDPMPPSESELGSIEPSNHSAAHSSATGAQAAPSGTAESASDTAEPKSKPARRRLLLMGHSTGGLITSLWAHFNPELLDALVLNSPWLEFQVGNIGRRTLEGPVRAQARIAPMSHLVNPDPGFYVKSISNKFEGEWDINLDWKPVVMWAPTAAWMAAIFRGQDRVALGLELEIPVLVLVSAKSTLPFRWTPELLESDQVITVDDVLARAPHLGNVVTTVKIAGALHDVILSAPEIRKKAFAELERWLAAYYPITPLQTQ